MFLKEIKNFSKQNWWIYLLLSIALTIVYITWKWNLIEIIILFLANFLWNLFIMIMQANYSYWNNKIWAIYHLISTLTFTIISLYWLFYLNQYQYIIWQITYILAALKALFFYKLKKELKLINEYSIWLINIILIVLFIIFWKKFWLNINFGSIVMALWFSFVTTWLVSINDKFRYWINFLWIILIIIWAWFGVINWYILWKIDWVSLWYLILTSTTFVFYLKLLKNYIK